MKINEQIFREYDIRGMVGTELSEEFAYLLGRAYGELARENGKDNICIGWDARESSEPYAKALAKGMSEEGRSVILTGMGPTPLVYYAIAVDDLGGGIQVTGSHNPPDMNGFKSCLGTHTLSGPEIQDILLRMLKLQGSKPSGQVGVITTKSYLDRYVKELIENSKPHVGSKKLKVVVDGGNGVGGITGPDVLRGLGVEVVELYCEPDGKFPNHHPDPTVLENLVDLIAKVRETKADIGIGWDGDADRIGVVDENGDVIFGDMLMLIFGKQILKEKPGSTIIGDVKCSSRLFEALSALGGNPIMWKTGHSLIKKKLKESGGELGGEMSGHIFFKDRFYGFDDAVYATCRLIEILSASDGPASKLLDGVPRMVATPEIRLDCPEEVKFKIPELARERFKEFPIETIDGVRMTFPDGWALIRASNTQPILVLRFEATSESKLKEYQALVTSRLDAIKADIAASAANG